MVNRMIAAALIVALAGCTQDIGSRINGAHPTGGQVLWDGDNNRGVELTPGLYMTTEQRQKAGLWDLTYYPVRP